MLETIKTINPVKSKKKVGKKSFLRRLNDGLHLWMGLISGLVVFIVSITGCIYVFQNEIRHLTQPWLKVEAQDQPYVSPAKLLEVAQKIYPNRTPSGLTYGSNSESAAVGFDQFKQGSNFAVVFMNPYDAKVLKAYVPDDHFDFFEFIENGHRNLWLPPAIGRKVVGISILIFLFLLLTGLVMWWPKKWKKPFLRKALTIKWNARFRRVVHDLHNVLGFYSLIFAFLLAATGLFYSFKWFENGIYYVTSVGETKVAEEHPHSSIPTSTQELPSFSNRLEKAWQKVMSEQKSKPGGMYMSPVSNAADDPIEIVVYRRPGSFYDHRAYFFDQYTLKPLRAKGEDYQAANFADKLSALNYDIHVGSVWGWSSKLLAFIISLICASMPITGFLYWWNRK